jgi:hypothetical protein
MPEKSPTKSGLEWRTRKSLLSVEAAQGKSFALIFRSLLVKGAAMSGLGFVKTWNSADPDP